MNSGSLFVPLGPPFATMAPFQPLHASSLQGHRSSIISIIWFCFWYRFCAFLKSRLLKTHIIPGGFLAPSVHLFSFPSSPLERASAAKRREAVAWSRPRPGDHFGGHICSSSVAGYHLALTSALQHCQHNCAFRFLAAQVVVLGLCWNPNLRVFWV